MLNESCCIIHDCNNNPVVLNQTDKQNLKIIDLKIDCGITNAIYRKKSKI